MAKHIVFLIHGVGDTDPGWSASVQDVIKGRYAAFHISKLMPFDQHFELKEVNYNGKFDDRRAAWKAAPAPVAEQMAASGLHAKAVKKLLEWSALPGEEHFLFTHALDIVFYRFLSLVGDQVRASVQTQILDVLAAQPANEVLRWSVMAHSLGTSVAHDVLHQMFSPNRPASWGPLPANLFRPSIVMMIANVSRVLENTGFFGVDGDVFRSATRPSSKANVGACGYYINVRHQFDPIPKPKMFSPVDDWPDLETRSEKRFCNVVINAVEQPNVHDWTHYLKNPRTVAPLFRQLTVPAMITDQELDGLSRSYEASTPLQKFSSAIKKLENLSLSEKIDNWGDILEMMREYHRQFVPPK